MLHAPLRLIIIMFPLSDPRLKRVGAGVRWMTRCYADSRATGLYGFRTISHLLGLRRIIPNLCAGLWSDMSVHVIPSPPHLVPAQLYEGLRSLLWGTLTCPGGQAQTAFLPIDPRYPTTMSEREAKPPFPPFTEDSARKKVKAAQDGWNTKCAFPPRSLPPIPGPSPHLLQ